jgi:hypothetical protein
MATIAGQLTAPNAANHTQSAGKGIWASRTKREQMMIILLIVLVVVAGFAYFVVLPGIAKINTLTDEVAALEEQELTYRLAIAQTESYNKIYTEALAEYEAAKVAYRLPMDPESLDEMVTGFLLNAQFEPETLSMQPISFEAVYPYKSPALETVPFVTGGAIDASDGAAASETPSDAGGGGEGTPSSYVYSVNVSAAGKIENLYTLLDHVAGMTGIRIESYSFNPGQEKELPQSGSAAASTVSLPEKDSFSIVFKIYVFVEGAYQIPSAESATNDAEAS